MTELTTVYKQQKLIMEISGDIKELKRQHAEKDKRVPLLESHVSDLEQYSRINSMIMTDKYQVTAH